MQKDLYPVTIAQARKIELHSPKELDACKSAVQALRFTALNSDLAQEELAKEIGKAKKVLSRALNGSAGLPVDTLIKLMQKCDSVYLLEYMCHQMGGEFRFVSEEEREIRDLKEKLAVAEARRAA